jgi:Holliday junction resolvase-like predicted endonuclease
MPCEHVNTMCLNEFELIRKYRCTACNAVMMCACDESIGRTHLSHQLDRGVVLETQQRVPVTAGFQLKICRECRGLTPEAHPVASIPGRTSKIKRYYWRELAFREMELYEQWKTTSEGQAGNAGSHFEVPHLAEQALIEIKDLHAMTPKYAFGGMSQKQTLERFQVEILDLKADYVEGGTGRAQISVEGQRMSVESFACRHLERLGYRTLSCESRPFHAIFATLLGRLIEDPGDPKLRLTGIGDRRAVISSPPPVWWMHPEDFGTPGYGKRRMEDIEKYVSEVLPSTREGLESFFDECFEETQRLRTYLWAEAGENVATAKRLLEILAPETVKAILRYLVDSYWANYTGWPDLVAERNGDWFFAEVKSSHDKLSDDQKHWIEENAERLRLPFKLIKIHRCGAVTGAS